MRPTVSVPRLICDKKKKTKPLTIRKDTAESFGPVVARQTALIRRIMSATDYDTFRQRRLNTIVSEIRNVFAAVRAPSANDETTISHGLNQLAEQAWRLGERMLSSGIGFHFYFPQIGHRFFVNTMLAVCPTNEEPAQIQTRGARISLVVTPVITARDDRERSLVVHSIALADVVCMQ